MDDHVVGNLGAVLLGGALWFLLVLRYAWGEGGFALDHWAWFFVCAVGHGLYGFVGGRRF